MFSFFKKRLFEAISRVSELDARKLDELFFDIELALLEANVCLEVVEDLKKRIKTKLLGRKVAKDEAKKIIIDSLREEILDVLNKKLDFENILKNKPTVILFLGVNGSGKTLTVAKLAKWFKDKNYSVVIAASDTFRAASIEQLENYAKDIGVKVIKLHYGADPAAVAYNAIQHAKAKNIDVVLIDTAGRMHTNYNLLEEMKKIVRVAQPHLKIFVFDALTGNDAVEQAKAFNSVGIDAIIATKLDADEKGGALLSVAYVLQKPIIFVGTGQNYEDLEHFDINKYLKNLGL